jgi:hypothetical protein
LFQDISAYVLQLRQTYGATLEVAERPASKKRKVENAPSNGVKLEDAQSGKAEKAGPMLLNIGEVSFTVPQRKKFTLEFTGQGLVAKTAGGDLAFGVQFKDIRKYQILGFTISLVNGIACASC